VSAAIPGCNYIYAPRGRPENTLRWRRTHIAICCLPAAQCTATVGTYGGLVHKPGSSCVEGLRSILARQSATGGSGVAPLSALWSLKDFAGLFSPGLPEGRYISAWIRDLWRSLQAARLQPVYVTLEPGLSASLATPAHLIADRDGQIKRRSQCVWTDFHCVRTIRRPSPPDGLVDTGWNSEHHEAGP
jgi:hypothetical protein